MYVQYSGLGFAVPLRSIYIKRERIPKHYNTVTDLGNVEILSEQILCLTELDFMKVGYV